MRIVVMLGAVVGFLTLVAALLSGASAPQQAALAAIACGMAIIPYVGWRASQIDDESRENRKFREEILTLMKERPPTQ